MILKEHKVVMVSLISNKRKVLGARAHLKHCFRGLARLSPHHQSMPPNPTQLSRNQCSSFRPFWSVLYAKFRRLLVFVHVPIGSSLVIPSSMRLVPGISHHIHEALKTFPVSIFAQVLVRPLYPRWFFTRIHLLLFSSRSTFLYILHPIWLRFLHG